MYEKKKLTFNVCLKKMKEATVGGSQWHKVLTVITVSGLEKPQRIHSA